MPTLQKQKLRLAEVIERHSGEGAELGFKPKPMDSSICVLSLCPAFRIWGIFVAGKKQSLAETLASPCLSCLLFY